MGRDGRCRGGLPAVGYSTALSTRISAGLGDAGRTLAYLEQAIAAREGFVPMLALDHEFDFLRADPQFVNLLRRSGIPVL